MKQDRKLKGKELGVGKEGIGCGRRWERGEREGEGARKRKGKGKNNKIIQ